MIRYNKLGYVGLNVTDLMRARDWYTLMLGLQFNGTGESGELFFRSGVEHHSLVLHAATTPRCVGGAPTITGLPRNAGRSRCSTDA